MQKKIGNKNIRAVITGLLITMLLTLVNSCGQDQIISPDTTNITHTEQINTDNNQALFGLPDTLFSIESLVGRLTGGSLITGNISTGFSSINFLPLDLPTDTTISFQWVAGNTLEATFSPHGINFNNPVRVVFSYKSANITAAQEDSLRVYYYNETSEEWELIGGTVNKLTKTVTAYITHFSRYALLHG